MFCEKCGTQLAQGATFCPNCGTPVAGAPAPGPAPAYNAAPMYPQQAPVDQPSIGYAILGFFFPIIGLILFLVWKDQKPLQAKSVGKGALIGAIVSVVVGIIVGIIVATTANSYYGALGALSSYSSYF